MLKTGISILTIIYCTLCQAQSDSIKKLADCHLKLKFSYNSSLIYPGISSGIEFPFQQIDIQRLKKRGIGKSFTKGRFLTGNLSWYHHPYFHDNFYLTAEWVMRRTKSSGFISEFSVGPGYSRTFLGGTTYRVADNGSISIIRHAGYNYALVTVGGGFGYDFSMKRQLPVSIFGKMNLLSMFPYNSTIYFRPVLELGFRYMPGRIKSKVTKESILK